jgi:hypothetical protein
MENLMMWWVEHSTGSGQDLMVTFCVNGTEPMGSYTRQLSYIFTWDYN